MPDVSVPPLGHDLYLIDAFMHGAPENLACYLFDTPQRVLIECGPSRTIDHLFAALDYLGIDDAGPPPVAPASAATPAPAWLATRATASRWGTADPWR